MSEFMPRDLLPDLWEEILQRHWTYLETEEGMQKLEERKKLEACFKEFLSMVPHDRKFFLPETAHVLKKSIKEMDDFSAYKAMIGFESISQYANNLFTKPWRKEYRYIKMYSGFYAHDIGANLIDADKLFEAMGYKKLPDQTLMLDGPICPDQVTNVSRDAMAAYVECQIMKQIFLGLTASELSCSWQDIFNFRESKAGNASQAIRVMSYAAHERRMRKEKLNTDNCYATIQQQNQPGPPSQTMLPTQCGMCTHNFHNSQLPPVSNACNHQPVSQYGAICSIHSQAALPPQVQNVYMPNMGPTGHHYKPAAVTNYGGPAVQMPHSKSFEHYGTGGAGGENVNGAAGGGVPHRHSFDQPYDNMRPQQLESAYDCVDGYQSCNFSAYNHPYNRYPLPYNISSQLNNHFPSSQCAAAAATAMNNINQYPTPVVGGCNHKAPPPIGEPNFYSKLQPDQMYGDCNGYAKKPPVDICNHHGTKDVVRQYAYGSNGHAANDHLIDLDDRSTNDLPSYHNRNLNNLDGYDRHYNKPKSIQPNYDTPRSHPKDLYHRNCDEPDDIVTNNVYGYQQRSNDRKSAMKKVSDKYVKNAEILEQFEKGIGSSDHSRSRDDYDSYEDTIDGRVNGGSDNHRPHISNKDHDGVGSFESWDYVFQNLEKHGYSKDLGERGDLLMRGLDLDSKNGTGGSGGGIVGIEKRRSRNLDPPKRASTDATANATIKSKTLEKTDLVKETGQKLRLADKQITRTENDAPKIAVVKSTSIQRPVQTSTVQKTTKTTLRSSLTNNNNNNDISERQHSIGTTTSASVVAPARRQSSRSGGLTITKPTTNNGTTSTVASAATVGNTSEWSCRFCTYLNPETKRICEICCRSRDFVLDAGNTPTCV